MKLQESGENYLETILLLQQKKGEVRSVDIANELGFSKPSITRAMGILRQEEYIFSDDGFIHLTEKGIKKAKEVYERHLLIKEFLVTVLDVEPSVANADACRIEHVISDECFNKIKKYIKAK